MTVVDVVFTFVYLALVYLVAFIIWRLKKDDFLYRKYFLKGLTVKVVGGLAFAMVYTFYYTYGGDTKSYFHDVEVYFQYLLIDPLSTLEFVFGPNIEVYKFSYITDNCIHVKGTSEFFAISIMFILNLFAINNYFSLTILFSCLSFVGIWLLFTLLANKYPKIHKQMAISVLFIPSVFFWGSGLMKDTIVIGFVGFITYYFYKVVEERKNRIFSIIVLCFAGYIIFKVKAYVIISLVPAFLVWAVFNFRNRIKNKTIKIIVLPIVIIALGISVSFSLQILGNYTEKYSIDKVLKTAHGMQTWHGAQSDYQTFSDGRGSSYNLGDYEPTLGGVVEMIPASINVTLFRPYITEISSIVMAASALESALILLFSIYVFVGLGFFKILKLLNQDAFLLMALMFSLFFAFAIGFTSYNFGALVRYKIPCIPFYLASLFILQHKVREMRRKKRLRS